MPEPLVSIITPFYNPGRFLREAVSSVLAQTYANWELLLVNDGSSDESPAIAREFAAAHLGRIRVLEHEGVRNLGMCASRNLALAAAHGPYLALLDADDVWLPNKLTEQMEIACTYPEAGLIYGLSEYWKSWAVDAAGASRQDRVPPLAPGERIYPPGPLLLALNHPLGDCGVPCPSDLLVRTDILRGLGGFEESFNRYSAFEDQAFLAKLYLSTPVYVATRVWDRYRLHETSCVATAQRTGAYSEARAYYFQWLRQYLLRKQVTDARVWRAWRVKSLPHRHPLLYRLSWPLRKLRRGLLSLVSERR